MGFFSKGRKLQKRSKATFCPLCGKGKMHFFATCKACRGKKAVFEPKAEKAAKSEALALTVSKKAKEVKKVRKSKKDFKKNTLDEPILSPDEDVPIEQESIKYCCICEYPEDSCICDYDFNDYDFDDDFYF